MGSDILVACYSRSGNTLRLARELATVLGADFEEISEPRPRRGISGFLRCAFDAWRMQLPPIEPPLGMSPAYRTILLGGPIWIGRFAAPIRSFARTLTGERASLAFFCTMGGSDPREAFEDLARLSSHSPVATLAIDAAHLAPDAHRVELARFVNSVRSVALEIPVDRPRAFCVLHRVQSGRRGAPATPWMPSLK